MPQSAQALAEDAIRLAALNSLEILDSAPEVAFDGIVDMAKTACRTPVALISLVGRDRQWFKAKSGFEPCETPLDQSVCAHALVQGSTLIVPDLTQDPRTRDNALVTGEPFIRFYAGALLKTSESQPIGTLCVIDVEPRPDGLSPEQIHLLEGLAAQVVTLVEMRAAAIKRDEARNVERSEAVRARIAIAAGRIGTFDVDLAADAVLCSPEMCQIFGLEQALSYPAIAFQTATLPEDRALQSNARTRADGSAEAYAEYRIKRAHDGEVRWVQRRAEFIFDEAGTPRRFTGTISDVTERKLYELRQLALIELAEAIRESDTVTEVIADSARIVGESLGVARAGYAMIDLRAGSFDVQANWTAPGVESLVGHHATSSFVDTLKHLRSGQPLVVSNISEATWLSTDFGGYEVIGAKAQIKVPLIRKRELVGALFIHSAKARIWTKDEVSFVDAVADLVYTAVARVQAEAEQRLLNQELSHRLKNTLAMVTAIAKQTLKNVTKKDAVQGFLDRVIALSTAHDVLLQESWASARIRGVVENVTKLHVRDGRLTSDGPDIRLGPKATLSISMLLHELATNAMKYGALSNDGGRVEVTWSVVRGDQASLHLCWQEIGGPATTYPSSKGFGSRLIRTGICGTGTAELRYDPTGLVAEFSTPMSIVTET
jgi:hypothetical protein